MTADCTSGLKTETSNEMETLPQRRDKSLRGVLPLRLYGRNQRAAQPKGMEHSIRAEHRRLPHCRPLSGVFGGNADLIVDALEYVLRIHLLDRSWDHFANTLTGLPLLEPEKCISDTPSPPCHPCLFSPQLDPMSSEIIQHP